MKKLIALSLALACLLCACGPKEELPQPSPEAGEESQAVQVLNIFSYSPDTLNPLFTKNNANVQMLKLLFEGLVKCDRSQMPQPVLADAFSVTQDGLVWTVTLKPTVTFHDGTPLTARDVEASYNQVLASADDSIYAENLSNVESIHATDDYTVNFRLKSPQTNFVNLLDIPVVKAVDAGLVDGFSPIGTGPYQYASKETKAVVLTAYPNWWGEHPAQIGQIHVKFLPDLNTSAFAYEAKSIDVVNTDTKSWSKYAANSENHIAEYPSGNFHFLAFQPEHKLLKHYDIRAAIAHSINKNRIFDEVLLSHGTLTDTCISPDWWMYNDQAPVYAYDPKLAIEKIAAYQQAAQEEQDDKNGKSEPSLKLELLVNRENDIKLSVAGIIKECFQEVGIELTIQSVSWNTFTRRVEEGEYDLYLGEINYSPEVNPAYVLGQYEGYDTLLAQLQQQTTDSGRELLYDSIQDKAAAELPILPLYFDAAAMLYSSKLSGDIQPTRTNMFDNIQNWTLSPPTQ